MSKRKILHIPNYYHPHTGGIEQTARDIVDSLEGLYEQKVFCFSGDKSDRVDEVDGVEVVRAGVVKKVASQALSFSCGKLLKKTIKEYQPDIVVFHYPNPFVASYLLKYLKKKEIRFILYWHLDITKQKLLGKLFHRQNLKLLRRADQIVATSPNYVAGSPYLTEFAHKCTVIPSCINEERLKVEEPVKERAQAIRKEFEGKTLCFIVGRHVEHKGFFQLIEASKRLDDGFRILIGGAGPCTEKMKERAAGDNKVVFLGKLPDEELKAYLMASDIFCFPSLTKNEAFGLVLAEAMYFGKPAVTFTIEGSGVNFVSLNGETGIECPNGDSAAYAEALKTLAKDDELRQRYGENAQKRVEENFTYRLFKEHVRALLG